MKYNLSVATLKSKCPVVIFLILVLFSTSSVYSLEEPLYSVLLLEEGVEYRLYEPYLVVETALEEGGNYKAAGNKGFRRLFGYISGNNESRTEIAMTKPVQQVPRSEKAQPMARVKSVLSESGGYNVAFMLPRQYTLEAAPVPVDGRLNIRLVPARVMAVKSYSGRWTYKNFISNKLELLQALEKKTLSTRGEAGSAFYNPPFVLPFLRRNEVMIEVVDFQYLNGGASI